MIKHILVSLSLAFSSLAFSSEPAKEPKKETKRVCIMQKDSKTQKEKEVCKVVKVHRKLEGTKVPEKK